MSSDRTPVDEVSVRDFGSGRLASISAGSMTIRGLLSVPTEFHDDILGPLTADGRFAAGLNSLVVELLGTRTIVDPIAFAPGDAATPPDYRPTAGLRRALAALAISPADVDHVVFTHRHADHTSGALTSPGEPQFPNARHWLHADDWETMRTIEEYDGAVALRSLEKWGLLELFDGVRRVAPGHEIAPAPGETPGHSVVRFFDGAETFYYLGDLFHHPAQVEHEDWAPLSVDREILVRSRREILTTMVAERASGMMSHAEFPGWGTPRAAADGTFRWAAGDVRTSRSGI